MPFPGTAAKITDVRIDRPTPCVSLVQRANFVNEVTVQHFDVLRQLGATE